MRLNYVIEPLDPNDQSFLEKILYQMIYVPDGNHVPKSVIREPKVYQYIQEWDRYLGYGFIAVHPETDEKMGAAWIRYFDDLNPGYGFVKNGVPELCVAVFPEYRGCGIGTALIQAILETVDSEEISLSVSENNPAKRLYDRLGFSVVKKESDTFVMSRCCFNKTSKKSAHRGQAMKQKWIAGVAIFILIATFGLGPIDIGLYKTNIAKNESSGCAHSMDPNCSYTIQCMYKGKIVANHSIVTKNEKRILIKAYIDPYQFQGNYYLPFYKKFKMSYKAEFGNVDFVQNEEERINTSESDVQVVHFPKPWTIESQRIRGDVDGTMDVEIIGICSVKKAKQIAEESAVESIKNQIVIHAK